MAIRQELERRLVGRDRLLEAALGDEEVRDGVQARCLPVFVEGGGVVARKVGVEQPFAVLLLELVVAGDRVRGEVAVLRIAGTHEQFTQRRDMCAAAAEPERYRRSIAQRTIAKERFVVGFGPGERLVDEEGGFLQAPGFERLRPTGARRLEIFRVENHAGRS